MAVYDLEEQEQIAQMKAWWAQYGNWIVSTLLILAVGFAGWQLWNRYRDANAAEANVLLFNLQQSMLGGDEQKTFAFADELTKKHGSLVQAQLGALSSASMQFQKNNLDGARSLLEWAADKGKDSGLRDLARLRLATLLLQQGQHDAALARLQPVPEGALRMRFEDLRGDVLAAQGKPSEARTAWQAAINASSNESDMLLVAVIRIKLESLKG
ncbi:MAG: tetratricopeptide repeat protein [Azoarcus sp.]|jgi:predicted negative regulator of RcsB-dependent stress response|nr:tetratricopeptide repeat protein [Azoarcus sp.]